MSSMLPALVTSAVVGKKANESSSFNIGFGKFAIVFAILFVAGYYILGLVLGYSVAWETSVGKTSFPNGMKWFVWIMGIFFFACGIACIALGKRQQKKEAELRARIFGLSGEGLAAKDFLESRAVLKADGDITGVYVLRNKTNDKCYVGQSSKVIDRAAAHLTGRGNGDVYADFKYGAEFEVALIPLNGSGYNSLDELERETIKAYNAFDTGYNRTRGNH